MSRSDIPKPVDDPFALVGDSWPTESESAYHDAKVFADNAATTASTQSQSASDAEVRMADERGKTADSVSGGYGSAAAQLHAQALEYHTISAWMSDAAGSVLSAKRQISALVRSGTSEIRDALNSELSGTPAAPSSSELTTKYQREIAQVASKLGVDLDAIGHSLAGAPGASRTPSYTSVSTTPTPEHADPHVSMASYTGTPGAPAPEPQKLPEMPRASAPSTTESPSGASTPTTSVDTHSVNPTLSNLIAGSASPSGTPAPPSTSSPSSHGTSSPAGQQQAHQPSGQHQDSKSAGLPRIPSIPLPNIPAAAATISTAVTSSVSGQQLPASTTTTPGSSLPASTGVTPGTSGAAPMAPVTPGLAPIGGGLPTPPVMQPVTPAPQGTPPTPTPGVQTPAPAQQATAPAAPRGPAADLGWIQRNYGLAPGLELPKSETLQLPALFIDELPEPEATLHRVLASLRHQFEAAGWGQPMAVASIKRGFETRTVYVTADALSIHPSGILLPADVAPLDEMPNAPATSELCGSLMVTEKLKALIPRGWTVEQVLSTVSGGEANQSIEEYQLLVESVELVTGKVSRGRSDATDDEALRVFARAALGSAGCGEVDVESSRIRAARWVGVQPAGYLDSLARWYLSDAAEAMSLGNWGEAVYSAEKYMSIRSAENKAA
ncbi:Uncharacterised protein [Mycobacteroides abscessus subsp. abscessus]|uniref:hypothetical protein n=1 Tax=Mycobacteroides abscessus TaxID=36809 RepID=UPI000927FE90|nr:hypothetical protein [Mycobacteroides abscessus]MBE5451222.1 hypothetical protein [Mycobacteroides abscessus]SHW52979.1 Uncharacterised protein [Mycobacteroides abscessus subsp. abscessus]SHX58306.1 Uncharacterised protein [Mycobacteroides abscessus subsp. abscessus]SIE78651.1 Uncharacterised protein [Mycobacteroides abscessus subsp. abscessus]SII21834.1 Uncharacterised protein [Mycobacteroides abscessus subsp. abscessus]